MTFRFVVSRIAFSVSLLLAGCATQSGDSASSDGPAAATPVVMVTNRVLQELATAAFSPEWEVVCVDVAAGQTALPDRQVIGAPQQATLVLWHGAGYEPWREMVSLPSSRQNITTSQWSDELIASDDAVAHQHGPNGAQQTGPLLWASWLDPDLAQRQLQAVADASRQHSDVDEASLQRVDELQQQLRQLAERCDRLQQQPTLRVRITDEQLRYLVRRLGWKAELTAGDEDHGEFDLQLTTTSRDPALAEDPRVVAIDLCVTSQEESFVQRLSANMDRLEQALRMLPAESAVRRD